MEHLTFIGVFDEFERKFLEEQYTQHPDLLKQEMIATANILTAINKRREDEKKNLDGLADM